MKIYLVGGAIRDELMGLNGSDKDWVVVGATPEELISKGFTAVGKDFPVFLHPTTREEYALARTERKSAPGYHGFVFHADPSITLEEDLARRDLTINAIAKDEKGHLIDPFDGSGDIKRKLFRHVSHAFQEDPVRVLRLARFAARFPDFSVAKDTQILLTQMCTNGEVDALIGERVWQELSKGLMAQSPFRMFEVLLSCGALEKLFKDLSKKDLDLTTLSGVKNSLRASAHLCCSLPVRFAVLSYRWPAAQRLKAPKECLELAEMLIKSYPDLREASQRSGSDLFELLKRCDALRRPERFGELLLAARCLYALGGEVGESSITHNSESSTLTRSIEAINRAQKAALSVDHSAVAAQAVEEGLIATQIGEAINTARLKAIEASLIIR